MFRKYIDLEPTKIKRHLPNSSKIELAVFLQFKKHFFLIFPVYRISVVIVENLGKAE